MQIKLCYYVLVKSTSLETQNAPPTANPHADTALDITLQATLCMCQPKEHTQAWGGGRTETTNAGCYTIMLQMRQRRAYRCILWHSRVVVEGPELLQAVQAVVHLVLLQNQRLKVLQPFKNILTVRI